MVVLILFKIQLKNKFYQCRPVNQEIYGNFYFATGETPPIIPACFVAFSALDLLSKSTLLMRLRITEQIIFVLLYSTCFFFLNEEYRPNHSILFLSKCREYIFQFSSLLFWLISPVKNKKDNSFGAPALML